MTASERRSARRVAAEQIGWPPEDAVCRLWAAVGRAAAPTARPVRHGRFWLPRQCRTVVARCSTEVAAAAEARSAAVSARAKLWRFFTVSERLWKAVLVAVYVMVDISVYVVNTHASKGYTEQTVMLTSSLLSIIVGSMVSFGMSGRRALRDCFAPGNVVPILPVAASFSLAQLSQLQAFKYFDGAFIKLLGQMKLPLTALLSSMLLGRRYSAVQWQILILICVACVSFMVLRLGVKVEQVPLVGLGCISTWVVGNVLGSIFSERAFKGTGLPFAIVMTNIRIGEALSTAVLLWREKSFHLGLFFKAWDRSTILLAFIMVCDVWFSGLVVKNLSSVAQKVAKCLSLVVILALCTGQQRLNLLQALGAMLIVQSTALFATVTVKEHQASPLARQTPAAAK